MRPALAMALLAALAAGDALAELNPAARSAAERLAPGVGDVVDPEDAIIGNPGGDVTVVAFIDRESVHSKAAIPALVALAATDPGVRVALKELPLTSRSGVRAALAAAAARRQGEDAFRLFEAAMLANPGPPGEDAILLAASAAGLDLSRFAQDRADPALMDYLRRVRRLSVDLGVSGTPTFLVGPEALAGVRDVDTLRAAVARVRGTRP